MIFLLLYKMYNMQALSGSLQLDTALALKKDSL